MTSDPFIDALVAQLAASPDVLGLVLAGSSAASARRDEWSDQDFLVITADGAAERLRTDLSWLPAADDIVFSFRETAHGLKVLYRSGLLCEFAAADRSELATFALADYAVAMDKGGVADIAREVHARTGGRVGTGSSADDPRQLLLFFLSLVYVGTGRARRGERLSANVFLRDYAAGKLLQCAQLVMPTDATGVLDPLDPWRRVEQVWPALAAAIDEALSGPVADVGLALLDVADEHLSVAWSDYPAAEAQTVRALLHR